jgi:hypothetical protein
MHSADKPVPIYNTPSLIAQKAKMEGFIVFQYATRYPEARAWLADQGSKGKITYGYHIVRPEEGKQDGLDQCATALQGIFAGKNFGKWSVFYHCRTCTGGCESDEVYGSARSTDQTVLSGCRKKRALQSCSCLSLYSSLIAPNVGIPYRPGRMHYCIVSHDPDSSGLCCSG